MLECDDSVALVMSPILPYHRLRCGVRIPNITGSMAILAFYFSLVSFSLPLLKVKPLFPTSVGIRRYRLDLGSPVMCTQGCSK